MAVTRGGNTIIMAADGDTVAGPLRICGVKVVGGAGGATINLKKTSNSGNVVYTSTVGNSTEKFEEVNINFRGATLYLNVAAGGGTVYLFLK